MIGFLPGLSEIRQHLAEIQLQRSAFAFDLLDLVPEHLLRLVRLLEPRSELALVHLRTVLGRIHSCVHACELALRRLRAVAGMAKLLPKLPHVCISAFAPL